MSKEYFSFYDTPEQIQMCLHCSKRRCNNCLGNDEPTLKKAPGEKLSENEKKYGFCLNKTDMALLKVYPYLNTDKEIGQAIGKAPGTVQNIRAKLLLPPARDATREERMALVAKWTAD